MHSKQHNLSSFLSVNKQHSCGYYTLSQIFPVSSDMPDQAYDLVYQIYEYGPSIGVDWYEDWKLISFLIGGNDLCRFCNDPVGFCP